MDSTGINKLLENSSAKIENYQKTIESGTPAKQEIDLSSLISSLTETKVELQNLSTLQQKPVKISPKSLKALSKAIETLQENPTTEAKVDLIQTGLFGTRVPFWNLLKDIQSLLRTLKTLDESRGKKTASISDLDTE